MCNNIKTLTNETECTGDSNAQKERTEPFVCLCRRNNWNFIEYAVSLFVCVCACLYGCACVALPIVFWTILWMIFRVRNQIKTIFSSSACSNELASAFASTQCDRIRSDQIHRFYQQFLCYAMLSVMLLEIFLFHEKINKIHVIAYERCTIQNCTCNNHLFGFCVNCTCRSQRNDR